MAADGELTDRWAFAVSYLESYFNEAGIASGTCFFWKQGNRVFLVTNWHNLTGRNHITGAALHGDVAIPNRIRTWVYKKGPDQPDGTYHLQRHMIEIILCAPDYSNPTWLEHAVYGNLVDVAAVDVTSHIAAAGAHILAVNELEADAVLKPEASQDVFILGFPFGKKVGELAPIWKRGSVAFDPNLNAEGLPKILIDTATRPGMSGSVVLGRNIIVGRSVEKKDGTKSPPFIYASLDVVIGIYSGRHYPDFELAQLGIAWKRAIIEEVTKQGRISQFQG